MNYHAIINDLNRCQGKEKANQIQGNCYISLCKGYRTIIIGAHLINKSAQPYELTCSSSDALQAQEYAALTALTLKSINKVDKFQQEFFKHWLGETTRLNNTVKPKVTNKTSSVTIGTRGDIGKVINEEVLELDRLLNLSQFMYMKPTHPIPMYVKAKELQNE